MLLERSLADHLVSRADILLIGRQADLGVHHHLLVPWQQDQHVWLETLAIGALEADLGLVLTALFQAGMLEYPLQNQLAPVTLGFLALERLGQVGGFITQAQVQLLQAFQFLAQGEALTGLGLITFLNALFKGQDALLQRIEQSSSCPSRS